MFSRFVRAMLYMVLRFFGLFFYPFYRLYALRPKRVCTTVTQPLLMYSATKLAAMIRNRQVSSEEVVKCYIERATEVNHLLNAIVQERFAAAVEEAQEVDRQLRECAFSEAALALQKPLLGVPVTVKESIGVQGMSNGAGNYARSQKPASADAESIRQVREAGAIVLLVSNTPELCMNWETYNKVTGRTNNPFDHRRTPGGSSGGEAALLGAAASVIGVGSDIAGSLRLPASNCGVFGHKPTPRTVSVQGHVPGCSHMDQWSDVFTLGPMARYAEDLPLLLSVLAKREERCQLGLEEKVPIESIKFYYMEDDSNSWATRSIDKEILRRMRYFFNHLKIKYGIVAQKVDITDLQYCLELGLFVLGSIDGVDNVCVDPDNGGAPLSLASELFRYFTCRSKVTMQAMLYNMLKNTVDRTPANVKAECQELAKRLTKQFQDMLGNNGVFIYPSTTKAPNYHYQSLTSATDNTYYLIFNVLGLPVTNCPVGLNSDNLPLGIQVAGNVYSDKLTMRVAKEIESVFGGWTSKPFRN